MKKIPLFKAIGVELEYMIVDSTTLNVKPVCDWLLKKVAGHLTSDYENGSIAWSNELVTHVVELKTNGPAQNFEGLSSAFHKNIQEINLLLEEIGAVLMPTGAHPWMNPDKETVIWPHEHNEIYSLYNRIFDCRGHGWSNLQSMHLNIPFLGDEEFSMLHAAIRLILPIIPALSASTPLLDGLLTGFKDSRLETYRHNQEKLPSIAGRVIPEDVHSHKAYQEVIFSPILKEIKPYDTEGVMDKYFLNSRGAIARFDRGAIEIRVLDLQEAPVVDVALGKFIFESLRWLVDQRGNDHLPTPTIQTDLLADIFEATLKTGEETIVASIDYLTSLGWSGRSAKVNDIWQMIFDNVKNTMSDEEGKIIGLILDQGTLSSRIINALGDHPGIEKQREIYSQLINCLKHNQPFIPNN